MKKEVQHRIEESILIFLIILQIADFFSALPGDLDVLKKFISWIIMGYLFYRISFMRIIFGKHKKMHWLDLTLILSYFMLFFKSISDFAIDITPRAAFTKPLMVLIEKNHVMLDLAAIQIGAIIIILLSLYLAYTISIKKPSLMSILKEEGRPKDKIDLFGRFIIIMFLLFAFFIIVFDMMMEWLAMAVDAPLIMIAILAYLFIIVMRHKRFSPDSLLFKIGSTGNSFYRKFIEMFDSKKNILLAISGILILHLLTDMGIFIIHYLTGFQKVSYFSMLGPNHHMFWHLFQNDIYLSAGIQKLCIAIIYIANIIAALFLLLMPGLIWYKLYKGQGFKITKTELALFFSSFAVLLISPILKINRLEKTWLIGVDITTHSVYPSLIPVCYTALIGIIFFIAVYLLSNIHLIKEAFLITTIFIVDLFFGLYIFYYFYDSLNYYTETITIVMQTGYNFIGFIFICFLIIITLFYSVGYIIFLSETKKEYRYIRY